MIFQQAAVPGDPKKVLRVGKSNEPTTPQNTTNPNIIKQTKLIHQKVTRNNTPVNIANIPETPPATLLSQDIPAASPTPAEKKNYSLNLPFISQEDDSQNPIFPNPESPKHFDNIPIITQDNEPVRTPNPIRSCRIQQTPLLSNRHSLQRRS